MWRQSASGPVSRRRWDVRFVSDEPLAPYDQHVRRELSSWSLSLLRALDRATLPDDVERVAEGARCFRETALLASYLDRPDEARLLLHAALDFVRREAEAQKCLELLLFGVSPLLSMSRLDTRIGRPDEALFALERLSGLGRGQGLSFGALLVTRPQWQAIAAADPGAEAAIESSCAIETLRALLAAGRWEAALEGAFADDPIDPVLEAIRREAHLIALCHLGRGDAALRVAAMWAAEDHPVRRAIFELRHAETLACFGDPARAHALAEEVTRRSERRLLAGPATLFDLSLLSRGARLLAALGDPLAAEACWAALPAANAVGDVPLLGELSLRVVETEPREERRAEAMEVLRAIAAGSGYRIAAVERVVEREDGPLVPRALRERAPAYPELFSRLLGFDPEGLVAPPSRGRVRAAGGAR